MKTKIAFLISFFFFMGCSLHEEYDYRTPFAGEFNFTTITKNYDMCLFPSDTCIDGWSVISDTTLITSIIEPYDSNRIIIKFGNGILGWDRHLDTIKMVVKPIVLTNGDLDLPEKDSMTLRYFNGHFIGYDTLIMDMRSPLGGIGSYTLFEVVGIRKE